MLSETVECLVFRRVETLADGPCLVALYRNGGERAAMFCCQFCPVRTEERNAAVRVVHYGGYFRGLDSRYRIVFCYIDSDLSLRLQRHQGFSVDEIGTFRYGCDAQDIVRIGFYSGLSSLVGDCH